MNCYVFYSDKSNNMDTTMKQTTGNWAVFTHYKETDYISHGPFNFSKEHAYSMLEALQNEEERTNGRKNPMWIQNETTGQKLYIKEKIHTNYK